MCTFLPNNPFKLLLLVVLLQLLLMIGKQNILNIAGKQERRLPADQKLKNSVKIKKLMKHTAEKSLKKPSLEHAQQRQ